MARNVKTALPAINKNTGVLRSMAIGGDGTTGERLRRGLDPAHGHRQVDEMARLACFSRRQFHRLTLETTGETPGAHHRRLRLDRSVWLLLTSGTTVLGVALETGWESHESFTRAFRVRFGMTPSAFRKDRGNTLPFCIRAGFSIARHTYAKKIP